MLDVLGTSLTDEDKELLVHPLVGGFILFSRNFHSIEQISALTDNIRKSANGDILIAVDHEGGRVQRFRDGFSNIPAMGDIYTLCNGDIERANILAQSCGALVALEVQAIGIDLSFAPVLDINGISNVIGDRAFHQQPEHIITLATAFINGMHGQGMKTTGKHFPGHGSVEADSHIALPIDKRSQEDIFTVDLLPFKTLIAQNKLDAIMPAHVIYPEVDPLSVGFSPYWLQQVLRKEMAFNGVIFSDDLSMKGASSIGGYVERAEAAQQAGCDMLLLCNHREACIDVIDNANIKFIEKSSIRLQKLLKQQKLNWRQLTTDKHWQKYAKVLAEYSV